ncbi:MAG: aminodeoxychorismate synthase component I [Gammaproteobacteria bacterium]|nr:aminodeoxychorismate synthase component I [Gammaproteobacteria bacterium]MBU1624726.1 aminodeoxychorismate synthase component I [Gammaproteobacteria bacterium]MBU1982570.1 aminodeoxychorismate synthase component I [Gammaproteobacteria bacterium]
MLFSSPIPYLKDASPYFAAVRDWPWAAWLDSGNIGRFDIIVAKPLTTLETQGEQTVIKISSVDHYSSDDPFELIRTELGEVVEQYPDIPFAGGALGVWGYDLARRYQQLPVGPQGLEEMAQMAVGIYDWAIVIDHQEREARLVSRLKYPQTEETLDQVMRRIEAALSSVSSRTQFIVQTGVTSNLSPAEYRQAYEKVQDYLLEGDCYQVNLAQRFTAKASGDAFLAYQELRRLSPAPYSAFMDWPHMQVLCASPERFLQVKNGKVETKPIKGTRARARDQAEDECLANDLLHNPKDRAENLMIVDLLRNDLGKSCEPGSVLTPKLFELESYSNVHHLVSTVEGRLKNGCDALHVLRDCFPGGSITGAPKRRAMEIIEQLEPNRRGVYCGSIGYIGFDGQMDTNITIRTMVYAQGEICCWAGGGIVADSRSEEEYQETFDKASVMLEILQRFSN